MPSILKNAAVWGEVPGLLPYLPLSCKFVQMFHLFHFPKQLHKIPFALVHFL